MQRDGLAIASGVSDRVRDELADDEFRIRDERSRRPSLAEFVCDCLAGDPRTCRLSVNDHCTFGSCPRQTWGWC
jgi:hypothetical protein